jgi:hypothetical protein
MNPQKWQDTIKIDILGWEFGCKSNRFAFWRNLELLPPKFGGW